MLTLHSKRSVVPWMRAGLEPTSRATRFTGGGDSAIEFFHNTEDILHGFGVELFRLCDKFPQGFGIGVTLIKKFLRREIDSAVVGGFTRFMSGFADGVD